MQISALVVEAPVGNVWLRSRSSLWRTLRGRSKGLWFAEMPCSVLGVIRIWLREGKFGKGTKRVGRILTITMSASLARKVPMHEMECSRDTGHGSHALIQMLQVHRREPLKTVALDPGAPLYWWHEWWCRDVGGRAEQCCMGDFGGGSEADAKEGVVGGVE